MGAECHWQERKRKDMSIYYNKCSKSEGKLQALVPSASAMGRPEVRETNWGVDRQEHGEGSLEHAVLQSKGELLPESGPGPLALQHPLCHSRPHRCPLFPVGCLPSSRSACAAPLGGQACSGKDGHAARGRFLTSQAVTFYWCVFWSGTL